MDNRGEDFEDEFADEDEDLDLEEGEAYQEADEAISEDENELVVLDPDHPLMQRFQDHLKNLLERQVERLQIDKRELDEDLKKKRHDHLELGNELYNLQQELAKAQMELERAHDNFTDTKKQRQQQDMTLDDTRRMFKDMVNTFNQEKKKEKDLRQEVDNLALRIFYMKNAKEDVLGDISVMRRAAEKADGDLGQAEEVKMKQDLLVDRLVEQTDKLREEIALYDAQIMAQSDEMKIAREAVGDAQTEIQTIGMERKQLMSQWNSSLIGLTRRNEAYAAMQEALHQKNESIRSLDTELEGYKKSITKEQEKNEKFTLTLNRTENDYNTVKRMLQTSRNKHDLLKQDYSTQTRMLHESETALMRATSDKTLRQNEVNAVRKQIEREFLEKVKLEDSITEQIRSKLTMKKAAEYTNKLTNKLRDRTRDVETQIALVENDISKEELEAAHTKSRVLDNRKKVKELDEEIVSKNNVISKSEQVQSRNNIAVERKQGEIDQLNKKLEHMIVNAGGVELGPLEITINSLNKSIQARQDEIANSEQLWLREQHELVRIVNEKKEQTDELNRLKKQFTILSQKKLRIEGDIESEIGERSAVERGLKHLENDMQRLNGLIFREMDSAEQLAKHNALLETDFVRALKEEEKVSMEMKEKLLLIREKKEKLLNELVEAERHIMLWEKKIQLAQETRSAVDSDIGQGEIKSMKSEIHRMEVRLGQLMRQQENLIQEMEKSVSRRDTIATRGEAQSKAKIKVVTKGNMQRELNELRKKIKQTIRTTNECDEDIFTLKENQRILEAEIDERNKSCTDLQLHNDKLNDILQELTDMKQLQIFELQSCQQTARYYQQFKDGKYKMLCKDEGSVDSEREKQVNRVQALSMVVDRLSTDFPQLLRPLAPSRSMINKRLGDM